MWDKSKLPNQPPGNVQADHGFLTNGSSDAWTYNTYCC